MRSSPSLCRMATFLGREKSAFLCRSVRWASPSEMKSEPIVRRAPKLPQDVNEIGLPGGPSTFISASKSTVLKRF